MVFLALIFIFGLAAASTVTEGQFQSGTTGSSLEIVKDWKLLAIMAVFISVILVAIAYMIGIGFEMPEIKAWANNELVQVFANVIIVITLIVTIAFIDALVVAIVMTSNMDITGCTDPSQSCLQAVVGEYLEQYVTAAQEGAKEVLSNNIDAMGMANRRLGLYCLTIYCLQAGYTTTIAGHYLLDVDMYSILFEYYTNLLASMEAQKFFVEQISFKMGPVLLAVGIVARAFFFTRKIGGLLIAVALGVTFFFPGMYIFDWITLDVALTGDKGLEQEDPLCPSECKAAAPIAYIEGGEGLETLKDVYGAFAVADANTAGGLIDGSIGIAVGSNGSANGKNVYSCYSTTYGYDKCPQACRELPYPSSMPQCTNDTSKAYEECADLPKECKVIRYVNDIDTVEYNNCPASCKVVPPLKSNCNTGACLVSSYDCRMAYRDDLSWRPTKTTDNLVVKLRCAWAASCNASLVAEESCVFVIPRSGSCSDLCLTCPAYCRVQGASAANLPASCKDGDGNILAACTSCTESCMVNKTNIQNLPMASECSTCPAERRVLEPSMPDIYKSGDCSPTNCPFDSDHRAAIPRNTCETCLFSEESYMYTPPINMGCSDICAPSDNAPVKDAGSYMNIGGGGLVGREEIKNVAKLILPAYLLPLFNIVATLIFIKGLSAMLGGDIDIPGISKVF